MAKINSDGTVTLKTTGRTGRKSGGGTPQTNAPLNIGIGGGGGSKIRRDRRKVADRQTSLKTESS